MGQKNQSCVTSNYVFIVRLVFFILYMKALALLTNVSSEKGKGP